MLLFRQGNQLIFASLLEATGWDNESTDRPEVMDPQRAAPHWSPALTILSSYGCCCCCCLFISERMTVWINCWNINTYSKGLWDCNHKQTVWFNTSVVLWLSGEYLSIYSCSRSHFRNNYFCIQDTICYQHSQFYYVSYICCHIYSIKVFSVFSLRVFETLYIHSF